MDSLQISIQRYCRILLIIVKDSIESCNIVIVVLTILEVLLLEFNITIQHIESLLYLTRSSVGNGLCIVLFVSSLQSSIGITLITCVVALFKRISSIGQSTLQLRINGCLANAECQLCR